VDLLLVSVLGALWGSFANVCIYRLPLRGGVVKGRSFCPKCKKKIFWYENIPILSYLILGGKCSKCKKKISFQYLLVESISIFSFLLIYYFFGVSLTTILLIILFLSFIVIFFIDLKHYIIPDILTFPMMVLGFLKSFDPNLNPLFPNYINSLLGGIIGYGIIWLLILFYKKIRNKEGMGLGDAKILAVVGFWFGWVSIPFVIFLSSTIALIVVIPDLLKKKKKLTSQIPFGPYIIIATIIFIVFKDTFLSLFL
tara:strand:+ start:654 stop:1415 length:762 start_codon:yes stop_codon:yes gene_type:complete